MTQQIAQFRAPTLKNSHHQGSAIEMMIHSLVNMVQAGRGQSAKPDGSRSFAHDH